MTCRFRDSLVAKAIPELHPKKPSRVAPILVEGEVPWPVIQGALAKMSSAR
jgi:hypothetical protein